MKLNYTSIYTLHTALRVERVINSHQCRTPSTDVNVTALIRPLQLDNGNQEEIRAIRKL